MRKVLTYLKEYQSKHFDAKLYLSIAVFLACCFVVNYTTNFEDGIIDGLEGTGFYWIGMFSFMAFPFVAICFILYLNKKSRSWLSSPQFWVRIMVGFGILAFDRIADIDQSLLPDHLSRVDVRFLGKCIRWAGSLLVNVLPLMLVYIIFESERPRNYYGLALKRFDPKPYFTLLAIAMIFIGIGSFFSDIQEYYPRFQRSGGEAFAMRHGIPTWVSVLMYEASYGIDFISVEVFFRGFLIHAFARTLGGLAVLPMVGSYAFLHFGKPMTEAISSVFGGYILGIISYYSRNVWGGIIIHVGVAWAMELFGYLQGQL